MRHIFSCEACRIRSYVQAHLFVRNEIILMGLLRDERRTSFFLSRLAAFFGILWLSVHLTIFLNALFFEFSLGLEVLFYLRPHTGLTLCHELSLCISAYSELVD